jgi:glycosyltransferase involved in cell wall biosynthesis
MTSGHPISALCLLTDAHGGQGGISQYNRDLLHALARLGDIGSITVLPRIARLPLGELPHKTCYELSALGGLTAYVKATVLQALRLQPIDVVICGHVNLVPLAVFVGILRRAPVVLCVHGIDVWTPTARPLTNKLLRSLDLVLSVSETTRKRFAEWSGFPASKVMILPCTFHTGDLGPGPRPPDLEEAYSLHGRKVLLTLGRLVGVGRKKGFDRVLDVMPRLVAEDPSICYVVAGDGPDRQRLERKARELGVHSNCVFTGFVPAERKADLLRLADAFVMPSKGEGFGIVLLEAMACGIPVVGSISDGTREALRDGRLGELVDPDDDSDLIRGIRLAVNKPKRVPEELDYFSFERFTERIADVVRNTLPLQGRSRSGRANRLLESGMPRQTGNRCRGRARGRVRH